MATTIIRNPDNVPGAVTTGYQAQNTVLFASMTGHNQVAINREARTMAQGSVFELNGNIARVTETEEITGSLMAEAINYVYAIPDGNNVGFHFSTVPPAWSATKGGWYRGETNERALITAITDSNGNIVGTNILTNELDVIVPPNAGGVSVFNVSNIKTHTSIHLDRGWHRYDIRSGGFENGGNGGNGDNAGPGNTGGTQGSGGTTTANRISITGVFFHNGGGLIVHIGGNGFPGQAGTSGAANAFTNLAGGGAGGGGGGGGSGAGEESYIISGSSKFSTERTNPGMGGNGGGGGAGGGGGVVHGGGGGSGTLGVSEGVIISEINWANRIGGNLGGVPGTGSGGGAPNTIGNRGGDAVSPAGMGFGGTGGGGGSGGGGTSATVVGGDGGNGGLGGAPGWLRVIGSNNAGSVQIWRLS